MESSCNAIKTRRTTSATRTEEISFMYDRQSKTICNTYVLNHFGGDYTCQEQLEKAQGLEDTSVRLAHMPGREGLRER